MTELHRIAIDTMSGDNGLSAAIPAALLFLKEYNDTALILVGDESKILDELRKHNQEPNERIKVQHASEVVLMNESPALALRGKKDSSMRVAINLVKDESADAAVSAGNTGALMATGRFVLRTLKGIDRPAICAPIPAASGHTYVLDLGANIDSTSEHLYQFAIMGSELATAIDGVEKPRVGLLNIGSEDMKGNEQVKAAHKQLQDGGFNYIGFVEGNDIFHGEVDVIVCDGFVGNVALKTSEGLAKMLSQEIKAGYTKSIFTKIAALVSYPVLKSFRQRFDHRRYNGASFLGLKGIVIKSHGGADDVAFANAIGIARKAVIEKVPDKIEEQLQKHLVD
ncbi:phosphate acyltransferase PlsX [Cocleimonas flava]|uniref:Phosphate acyltransferase n=1 Tax=Cocleimonas flava TaxID=634765 RepID=A0A4R1ETX8_9GAMM|nr:MULTISPECIES: phosphate acyltransferase PlsX [Cocleimonas]MEB8433475.1 phosphate acyltransferase PlsX [Cocleimonas sp. KMM 6892]MEC4716286.1 phosphate acyltransferase PlsX [Cocleimonas sp. KMM 6895]MEC4745821.1 phosphate acyltransferase PlsX [Cocleimonas sp. KMM 6896]TCJ85116.1 phosphate:acyl-[acyl carrier protein] acyltransferase [Cocleimonas flava]